MKQKNDTMPSEKIHFPNARKLSQIYVNDARHLDEVETALNVCIVCRDNWVQISGSQNKIDNAKALFELLDCAREQGLRIRSSDFHYTLRCVAGGKADELREIYRDPLIIKLKRQSVVPKTLNQKRYLQAIDTHTITFGIGPAGTGKTYLAMAMALKELFEGRVERIVLTRPAVEAGEALGFLPGELQEKILPYLTPLYDSMNDMVG
ncbi:MAG: PhoH family protein, partial [Verrucomicrobiota bacterium]|nr:PhoH family protein [Verrucomicrobiota bacterium]